MFKPFDIRLRWTRLPVVARSGFRAAAMLEISMSGAVVDFVLPRLYIPRSTRILNAGTPNDND